MIFPLLYNKFFSNKEYKQLFYFAQTSHLVGSSLLLILALRLNRRFGIPDLALYVLNGDIAQCLDVCLTYMPSKIMIGKLIKPGSEGTVSAFYSTV